MPAQNRFSACAPFPLLVNALHPFALSVDAATRSINCMYLNCRNQKMTICHSVLSGFKRRFLLSVCCCSTYRSASLLSNAGQPASAKVIIDSDPRTDDALAMLLVAYSPEVDVKGISIVAPTSPPTWAMTRPCPLAVSPVGTRLESQLGMQSAVRLHEESRVPVFCTIDDPV
jgi:hypothetical protein